MKLPESTSFTEISHPAVGRTPSGHVKMHAEMAPGDLAHLLGYDPRSVAPAPRRTKRATKMPGNVAEVVVSLQRDVQRSIDQSRVDEMVEYLHAGVAEGGIADWAEVDVVTSSEPDLSGYVDRHVARMPVSASYFITDGQHRYCALLDFIRKYPAEATAFTQAVAITVIPEADITEFAGQSFHDKNYLRAAVKVAKALATDTRDPFNRLAKDLAAHPAIAGAGGVDSTRDSLPPGSDKFTTHGVLYRFTRAFAVGRSGLDKGHVTAPADLDDIRADLWLYVDALGASFPSWTNADSREEYLFRTSAALQALGVIGHDLWAVDVDPETRAGMLAKIGERRLNWRKDNIGEWDGVIGHVGKNGAIVALSSRPAIDQTISHLRTKSGLAPLLREARESAADTQVTTQAETIPPLGRPAARQ